MSQSFDRWFNRQAPEVPVDAQAKRELWHRLEDRLHQRTQHRRRGAMGLVAVLIVLFGATIFDVSKLGSGNRDLVMRGDLDQLASGEQPTSVYDPLNDDRYGLDEEADQEFWETIRDQRAADDRTLKSASFYSFEGRWKWFMFFTHRVDGEEKDISSGDDPWEVENTMTRSDALWLIPKMDWVDEQIAGGQAEEIPARHQQLNGYQLWFRVHRIQTERGPLLHGVAIIPPDARPVARPRSR